MNGWSIDKQLRSMRDSVNSLYVWNFCVYVRIYGPMQGSLSEKERKIVTKFEKDCLDVSEKTEIAVSFFLDNDKQSPFIDDGTLHITKNGIRACFDVGNCQTLDGDEQDERTKQVMTLLGMEITKRVLT